MLQYWHPNEVTGIAYAVHNMRSAVSTRRIDMGKREFGEEEVIDVQEEAVDTSDVSADNMISEKELEARAKKEARKKEWADNKIMLRERKAEMYEVLLANGFDQAYCDGLQKIIGETYVKKARTKRVPRLAQRDQFVALFNDEDGNGIIGKVVKGMDIFTDATSALGGIGKDNAGGVKVGRTGC